MPDDDSCSAVGLTGPNPYNGWYTHISVSDPASGWGSKAYAPQPPAEWNTPTQLTTIGCDRNADCVAFGYYTLPGHKDTGMFEALGPDPQAHLMTAPLPANHGADPSPTIAQISCGGPGHCVAVGSYADKAGVRRGLIETDVNNSWSAREAPLMDPSKAGSGVVLSSVSCVSATSCTAVGVYESTAVVPPGFLPDPRGEGVVETLANGVWTPSEAALPEGGTLTGVTCATPSSCLLTGNYLVGSKLQGLFAVNSAGTWTTTPMALPSDSAAGFTVMPRGVSCPTANWCEVAAQYDAGDEANLQPMSAAYTITW